MKIPLFNVNENYHCTNFHLKKKTKSRKILLLSKQASSILIHLCLTNFSPIRKRFPPLISPHTNTNFSRSPRSLLSFDELTRISSQGGGWITRGRWKYDENLVCTPRGGTPFVLPSTPLIVNLLNARSTPGGNWHNHRLASGRHFRVYYLSLVRSAT